MSLKITLKNRSERESVEREEKKRRNDEVAICEMEMKIDCGVGSNFRGKWPITRLNPGK